MGQILRTAFPLRIAPLAFASTIIFVLGFSIGCQKVQYVDSKPLDQAGMEFSSVQALKAMNPTDAEIAQVAKAKKGGLSDKTCIELLRISREPGQTTEFADPADGLAQVGMTESEILELARMKQLGIGVGELQAMRLTGLSDSVVMEVARRRAAGKQALSGVSLARLKDTGLSEPALFEMVRRGIRDSEVPGIVALLRARASESDVLRRYAPEDVTPPGAVSPAPSQ